MSYKPNIDLHKLNELGFKEIVYNDGLVYWEFQDNGFTISVEPDKTVNLTRTDKEGRETDPIEISCHSNLDIEMIIDWIGEE